MAEGDSGDRSRPRAVHRQRAYALRFDWGPFGAAAITDGCDVAVVVDVLSFTTTLTVAADRGVAVFPFRSRDRRAGKFAAARDATLAVGRADARPGQVSLSPHSVRTAAALDRLVLPSPNGSAISAQLARTAPLVMGVSLRNRGAAAGWLLALRQRRPDARIAVVAAGERWPDESLRPSVEDQWGAGSLIDLLRIADWPDISPEAHAAAATFQALDGAVTAALANCASGRELIEIGYPQDVRIAAELDGSVAVPVLHNDAFTPAGPPGVSGRR
ncbi:MAG TPA: 2-phosphosulfolactate phosphatase [Pseudonocardia sp.]